MTATPAPSAVATAATQHSENHIALEVEQVEEEEEEGEEERKPVLGGSAETLSKGGF